MSSIVTEIQNFFKKSKIYKSPCISKAVCDSNNLLAPSQNKSQGFQLSHKEPPIWDTLYITLWSSQSLQYLFISYCNDCFSYWIIENSPFPTIFFKAFFTDKHSRADFSENSNRAHICQLAVGQPPASLFSFKPYRSINQQSQTLCVNRNRSGRHFSSSAFAK